MNALDRFNAFVSPEPNSGCWLWTGNCTPDGYGMFQLGVRKKISAHRFAYLQNRGEIPDGAHLDHKCRTRCCCNPDHLEPVTPRVNILRGTGWAARNAAKTHCKRGHPFDEANTKPVPGGRACRECKRLTQIERRAKALTHMSSDTEFYGPRAAEVNGPLDGSD